MVLLLELLSRQYLCPRIFTVPYDKPAYWGMYVEICVSCVFVFEH